MASIVFKAFSDLNNNLCAPGARGYLTALTVPLIVGGLNIVVWILILVTAALIFFAAPDWKNSSNGTDKSYGRSVLFSILFWYLGLLGATAFYKLFFCKATVGVSQKYSELQGAKAEGIAKSLVSRYT